eukprot:918799-Prymnesium_polylepis.1
MYVCVSSAAAEWTLPNEPRVACRVAACTSHAGAHRAATRHVSRDRGGRRPAAEVRGVCQPAGQPQVCRPPAVIPDTLTRHAVSTGGWCGRARQVGSPPEWRPGGECGRRLPCTRASNLVRAGLKGITPCRRRCLAPRPRPPLGAGAGPPSDDFAKCRRGATVRCLAAAPRRRLVIQRGGAKRRQSMGEG